MSDKREELNSLELEQEELRALAKAAQEGAMHVQFFTHAIPLDKNPFTAAEIMYANEEFIQRIETEFNTQRGPRTATNYHVLFDDSTGIKSKPKMIIDAAKNVLTQSVDIRLHKDKTVTADKTPTHDEWLAFFNGPNHWTNALSHQLRTFAKRGHQFDIIPQDNGTSISFKAKDTLTGTITELSTEEVAAISELVVYAIKEYLSKKEPALSPCIYTHPEHDATLLQSAIDTVKAGIGPYDAPPKSTGTAPKKGTLTKLNEARKKISASMLRSFDESVEDLRLNAKIAANKGGSLFIDPLAGIGDKVASKAADAMHEVMDATADDIDVAEQKSGYQTLRELQERQRQRHNAKDKRTLSHQVQALQQLRQKHTQQWERLLKGHALSREKLVINESRTLDTTLKALQEQHAQEWIALQEAHEKAIAHDPLGKMHATKNLILAHKAKTKQLHTDHAKAFAMAQQKLLEDIRGNHLPIETILPHVRERDNLSKAQADEFEQLVNELEAAHPTQIEQLKAFHKVQEDHIERRIEQLNNAPNTLENRHRREILELMLSHALETHRLDFIELCFNQQHLIAIDGDELFLASCEDELSLLQEERQKLEQQNIDLGRREWELDNEIRDLASQQSDSDNAAQFQPAIDALIRQIAQVKQHIQIINITLENLSNYDKSLQNRIDTTTELRDNLLVDIQAFESTRTTHILNPREHLAAKINNELQQLKAKQDNERTEIEDANIEYRRNAQLIKDAQTLLEKDEAIEINALEAKHSQDRAPLKAIIDDLQSQIQDIKQSIEAPSDQLQMQSMNPEDELNKLYALECEQLDRTKAMEQLELNQNIEQLHVALKHKKAQLQHVNNNLNTEHLKLQSLIHERSDTYDSFEIFRLDTLINLSNLMIQHLEADIHQLNLSIMGLESKADHAKNALSQLDNKFNHQLAALTQRHNERVNTLQESVKAKIPQEQELQELPKPAAPYISTTQPAKSARELKLEEQEQIRLFQEQQTNEWNETQRRNQYPQPEPETKQTPPASVVVTTPLQSAMMRDLLLDPAQKQREFGVARKILSFNPGDKNLAEIYLALCNYARVEKQDENDNTPERIQRRIAKIEKAAQNPKSTYWDFLAIILEAESLIDEDDEDFMLTDENKHFLEVMTTKIQYQNIRHVDIYRFSKKETIDQYEKTLAEIYVALVHADLNIDINDILREIQALLEKATESKEDYTQLEQLTLQAANKAIVLCGPTSAITQKVQQLLNEVQGLKLKIRTEAHSLGGKERKTMLVNPKPSPTDIDTDTLKLELPSIDQIDSTVPGNNDAAPPADLTPEEALLQQQASERIALQQYYQLSMNDLLKSHYDQWITLESKLVHSEMEPKDKDSFRAQLSNRQLGELQQLLMLFETDKANLAQIHYQQMLHLQTLAREQEDKLAFDYDVAVATMPLPVIPPSPPKSAAQLHAELQAILKNVKSPAQPKIERKPSGPIDENWNKQIDIPEDQRVTAEQLNARYNPNRPIAVSPATRVAQRATSSVSVDDLEPIPMPDLSGSTPSTVIQVETPEAPQDPNEQLIRKKSPKPPEAPSLHSHFAPSTLGANFGLAGDAFRKQLGRLFLRTSGATPVTPELYVTAVQDLYQAELRVESEAQEKEKKNIILGAIEKFMRNANAYTLQPAENMSIDELTLQKQATVVVKMQKLFKEGSQDLIRIYMMLCHEARKKVDIREKLDLFEDAILNRAVPLAKQDALRLLHTAATATYLEKNAFLDAFVASKPGSPKLSKSPRQVALNLKSTDAANPDDINSIFEQIEADQRTLASGIKPHKRTPSNTEKLLSFSQGYQYIAPDKDASKVNIAMRKAKTAVFIRHMGGQKSDRNKTFQGIYAVLCNHIQQLPQGSPNEATQRKALYDIEAACVNQSIRKNISVPEIERSILNAVEVCLASEAFDDKRQLLASMISKVKLDSSLAINIAPGIDEISAAFIAIKFKMVDIAQLEQSNISTKKTTGHSNIIAKQLLVNAKQELQQLISNYNRLFTTPINADTFEHIREPEGVTFSAEDKEAIDKIVEYGIRGITLKQYKKAFEEIDWLDFHEIQDQFTAEAQRLEQADFITPIEQLSQKIREDKLAGMLDPDGRRLKNNN